MSDTSEVELPSIHRRLGHVLAHDAQAPLRMLAPVLASLAEVDDTTRQRRLDLLQQAVADLDTMVSGLVAGLRADVDVTGSCSEEELAAIAHRSWGHLAGAHDQLRLALAPVPLPASTCETLLTDLLAHALADREDDPRHVAVTVTSDGTAHRVAVADDGRAPGVTPAGPVRTVDGSTARALLAAQRVAEALQGRLKVASRDHAMRVTLYW